MSERANSLCAVIPAAGAGTRLGMEMPKILVPIFEELTVWNVLREKLSPLVDRITLVLSPAGLAAFQNDPRLQASLAGVDVCVQEEPVGMGDAIFSGYPSWKNFESILILWGDQVFVSAETLRETLTLHSGAVRPALTMPLIPQDSPYVDYLLDDEGRISRILQTREGDACRRNGFSDVGTFLLSTSGLETAWQTYLRDGNRGAATGEINFLPFLAFASSTLHWSTKTFLISDPREARGINTPADLALFRDIWQEKERPG